MKNGDKFSRRDLALLAPLLAPAAGSAQAAALVSKLFPFQDLPVLGPGPNHFSPIFNGELHNGLAVELHETELAAGQAPHPPHRHEHEEVVVVLEGTLEVMVAGRHDRLGPGSVAFLASNDEHGFRNGGASRVRYMLFALGPDWQYRKSVGASYKR